MGVKPARIGRKAQFPCERAERAFRDAMGPNLASRSDKAETRQFYRILSGHQVEVATSPSSASISGRDAFSNCDNCLSSLSYRSISSLYALEFVKIPISVTARLTPSMTEDANRPSM